MSAGLEEIYRWGNGERLYLTPEQLRRANRQSSRLGLKRNLSEGELLGVRHRMVIPVERALEHIECFHGCRVIRLTLALPEHAQAVLDVTEDMWGEIKANQPAEEIVKWEM